MKTSNQLVVTALALTVTILVWYDLRLKVEYQSGAYKIPYSNFASLPYTGFDIVDLPSSTAANVRFVQGPFSVRVDKGARDYVFFHQQGHHLVIDAAFERNYQWNSNPYLVVISCPTLTKLTTGASYRAEDHAVTDSIAQETWNMRQVLIEGFRQDSLSIEEDYGSTVVLADNKIGSLHSVTGKSRGSGSRLIVQSGNELQVATLDIRCQSKLILDNAVIGRLTYLLGDSAELIVKGRSEHLLHQPKLNQP